MYKLDRQITKYIKGFAIAIMVAHHLFAGNDNYGAGISAFGKSCKICVGIYAFMSGFGYFYMKDKTYRNSFHRIRGLLERYWLQMFLIFFPIAVGGGYVLSVKNVVINLFALRPNINWFSWYVYFYVFIMLVFPVYRKLCKESFAINLMMTVAVSWLIEACIHTLPWYGTNCLVGDLFDCFLYFPVAAIGFLVARHDIYGKIESKILTLQKTVVLPFLSCLLIEIGFLGRYYLASVMGLNLDVIYVPIMVFGLYQLLAWLKDKFTEKSLIVLSILGMYSTEIWFLHSVFFSQELNWLFGDIIWLPKYPILIFVWCFVLCLPVSALLHWIVNRIDGVWKV